MSFFDDADALGDGSIWDSGLDIFGKSNISKVLEGSSFTVDELLAEDEFIQEVQGQGKPIINYLTSASGLHSLVRYLAVPQRADDERRAFRFPYMAAEAICCNVPGILDALTSRGEAGMDHLTLLFSVVDPSLRSRIKGQYSVDASGDVGQGPDPFLLQQGHRQQEGYEVRPYLAAYVAKVVALLCRMRPAAMMRFLDRCPGIAAGLVAQLQCGSVASILRSILALPWAADGNTGMSHFYLSRCDERSLLDLLLGCIKEGMDGSAPGSPTAGQGRAMAAGHAADVLVHAIHSAVCAPHAKFEAEGYNAARLAKVREGPSASSNSQPLEGQGPDEVDVDAVLTHENLHMDAAFHSAQQSSRDRLPVRLWKELRDGQGSTQLLGLLQEACGRIRAAADQGTTLDTAAQTACEAPLKVLHAALSLCALSYRHQASLGYGYSSDGSGQLGPCPQLLVMMAQGPLQEACEALDAVCTAAEGPVVAALSHKPDAETRSPRSGGIRPAQPPAPGSRRAPTQGQDVETGVAPPPSYGAAPRLGIASLSLVRCLVDVLRCCWPEVESALQSCGLARLLLRTLSTFPWHSILHKGISDGLVDVLHHGSAQAKRHVLVDGRLLTSLVSGCRLAQVPARVEDLAQVRKVRVGYAGHLAAIATALLGLHARGALPASVAPMLPSHSDWWGLVDRELAVAGVAHGVLIGGMAPDVKASGNVGASADATGGPAKSAVDEVAVLEDKEEGGSTGSAGSGGSSEEGDREGGHGWHDREEDERDSGALMGGHGGSAEDKERRYLQQAQAGAGVEDEEEDEQEAQGQQASEQPEAGGLASAFAALEEDQEEDEDQQHDFASAAMDFGFASAPAPASSAPAAAVDDSDFGVDFPTAAPAPAAQAAVTAVGHAGDDFGFDAFPSDAGAANGAAVPGQPTAEQPGTAVAGDFGFDDFGSAANGPAGGQAAVAASDDFGAGDFGFESGPGADASQAGAGGLEDSHDSSGGQLDDNEAWGEAGSFPATATGGTSESSSVRPGQVTRDGSLQSSLQSSPADSTGTGARTVPGQLEQADAEGQGADDWSIPPAPAPAPSKAAITAEDDPFAFASSEDGWGNPGGQQANGQANGAAAADDWTLDLRPKGGSI